MRIQIKKKGFEILRGKLRTAELKFPMWYSLGAEGKINTNQIKITPAGAFKSTYHFLLNGRDRGSLKLNWKGNCKFSVDWELDGQMTEYRMKKTSAFKFRYQLLNEQDEPLLTVESKWNWSKFGYEYASEIHADLAEEQADELLLYAGFAMRAMQMQQGAS